MRAISLSSPADQVAAQLGRVHEIKELPLAKPKQRPAQRGTRTRAPWARQARASRRGRVRGRHNPHHPSAASPRRQCTSSRRQPGKRPRKVQHEVAQVEHEVRANEEAPEIRPASSLCFSGSSTAEGEESARGIHRKMGPIVRAQQPSSIDGAGEAGGKPDQAFGVSETHTFFRSWPGEQVAMPPASQSMAPSRAAGRPGRQSPTVAPWPIAGAGWPLWPTGSGYG